MNINDNEGADKEAVKEKKYFIKVKLIVIAIIALLIGVLLLLKLSQKACEWYSRHISANIVKAIGFITRVIPFSLYEILIYIAAAIVIAFIIAIIVYLCKKKFKVAASAFCNLCIIILAVSLIYTASASINYGRKSVDIPMYEEKIGEQEIYLSAKSHINRLNELAIEIKRDSNGNVINPYSLQELADKIEQLYAKHLNNGYFSNNKVAVKKWLLPQVLAQLHLSGVFFAPTAEANINTLNAAWSLPATTAHEMAHGKGVMRESDANLAAYYVTMKSDDPYIAYSGCMHTLNDILNAARVVSGKDKYDELIKMISDRVIGDFRYYEEVWSQYTGLEKIGEFFNNIYLKLSGVKEGTGDYTPSMSYTPISDWRGELIVTDNGDITVGGERVIIDKDSNILLGGDSGEIIGRINYTRVQRTLVGIYAD